MSLGIALAAAASLALNLSYLLQHAGSRSALAVSVRRPVASVRSLLRSRLWIAGLALGMTGWALHIGALARAPISLVQTVLAAGLALLVPLSWSRVGRRERSAVLLAAVGLALLAIGLRAPGPARAPGTALALYLAGASAVALLARGGLAAGLFYGAGDLAVKALTIVAREHGIVAALVSPWLPVVAAVTAGAFFTFQRALQSGRPVTVIALMTAATNVLSVIGGFVVFGEPLGHGAGLAAVHALALTLILVAGWWLAPLMSA